MRRYQETGNDVAKYQRLAQTLEQQRHDTGNHQY